ncbi:hypothetical protein WN55_09773 [Dufourea novaeangliae]|uniref:Uncharacterized protein n=2 Tax=Dufourea novaeangliae TaxID=178035 RepID=A0A154P0U7_DUFNO|nr:hypothetical protein WN55_09773 [Dufourea novaeangliae]
MCGDTMEPSAPPVEASPFIDHQKSLPYILYNNNKNVKDKNTLVHAGLLKPPNWVQCHPNYENNLNNNNDNTNTLEHSRLETPSTNDSNTWITQ